MLLSASRKSSSRTGHLYTNLEEDGLAEAAVRGATVTTDADSTEVLSLSRERFAELLAEGMLGEQVLSAVSDVKAARLLENQRTLEEEVEGSGGGAAAHCLGSTGSAPSACCWPAARTAAVCRAGGPCP